MERLRITIALQEDTVGQNVDDGQFSATSVSKMIVTRMMI